MCTLSRKFRGGALQRRRKEAVGSVQMRKQPQKQPGIERDAGIAQYPRAVQLAKFRMRLEKRGDDALVLLGEQAAGGVNQPPARLQQPCCCAQYGALLD